MHWEVPYKEHMLDSMLVLLNIGKEARYIQHTSSDAASPTWEFCCTLQTYLAAIPHTKRIRFELLTCPRQCTVAAVGQ
jgi:hypothetical protein